MEKNIFDIISGDFFKPLTSKYKRIYADTILLIYNSFKPEISYGVNRDVVVSVLMDYFDADDDAISFDDETYVSDSRDKANGVIAQLKSCGWIEYEQAENHQINVVLFDHAVPVIESIIRIIKEEETEYQGIISQIHASLQNDELYSRPYELIIMGVEENTERLISELKRLNASIKRHMDKQTNDMDASEILEHFFKYHQDIGSKAYLRMKTGDNISYFRTSIIERIERMLENDEIMDRAAYGYMEIKQEADKDNAKSAVIETLQNVKSSFYKLDDIIEEIDNKHRHYIRNAVMRARFLLSTGNNLEGKISRILDDLSNEINKNDENINEILFPDPDIFNLFPQSFISPESLKTLPVRRDYTDISSLGSGEVLSEELRETYKEALREKNRRRFSRKNINQFVVDIMGEREKIAVTDIPVESRRDLIRIIYISIYSGNRANNYRIERTDRQVKLGGFTLPYFDILRS